MIHSRRSNDLQLVALCLVAKMRQYPEELEEIFTQRDSAYRAVA